jgi:hypothetical protein
MTIVTVEPGTLFISLRTRCIFDSEMDARRSESAPRRSLLMCCDPRSKDSRLPSGLTTCHVMANRLLFLCATTPALVSGLLLLIRAKTVYLQEDTVKLSLLHIGFWVSLSFVAILGALEVSANTHAAADLSNKLEESERATHHYTGLGIIFASVLLFIGTLLAQMYSNVPSNDWERFGPWAFIALGAFVIIWVFVCYNKQGFESYGPEKQLMDLQLLAQSKNSNRNRMVMLVLLLSIASGGILLLLRRVGEWVTLNKQDELYTGYIELIVPFAFVWGAMVLELVQNFQFATEKRKYSVVKAAMWLFSRPATHMVVGLGAVIAALFMFAFLADHPSWANSEVTAGALVLAGSAFLFMGILLSHRFFGEWMNPFAGSAEWIQTLFFCFRICPSEPSTVPDTVYLVPTGNVADRAFK